MTTSAQRGHVAFCAYDTQLGEGTFDPSTATKFKWQRHKATEISMSPQEFSDMFPQEVGESIFPTGTYKMGAYVGGTMTMDARLASAFGHILYAISGSKSVVAAAGQKVAGTLFKPAADTTSLPWLAVRRYVPAEGGTTGDTEYFVDCRVSALTLTLPQMGIMQAQAALVGRKPYWDSAAEITTADTNFEDASSVGMSHSAKITLSGFATELGAAGAGGKFTGAQLIFTNGTTTPQQEMILGSYHPDTYQPLSRSLAFRLAYKWKDPALYRKLWQVAATGSPTGYDNVWNPSTISSPISIDINSVTPASVGKDPFELVIAAPNVDWTISSPTLVPGRMIQVELTGVVKAVPAADPWTMTLYNGVAYTFGS
jgi:hypothetical protein